MIERFVADFAKLIACEPQLIEVERTDIDPTFSEIIIYAHQQDVGKIIGKDGNMINSIKTVVSGCKAKNQISYRILVKPIDELPSRR
ncbi:RNA-binding protein [Campylobacterota bacterium]|nr:RNA-binding protein [Campylobacterota bacterium]GHV08268.1 RNA-binding protein [Campylobacterota bacterium]